MTYGPNASHITRQMPRRAEPDLFDQDGLAESFEYSVIEPVVERNSRWPSWWLIMRARWPR